MENDEENSWQQLRNFLEGFQSLKLSPQEQFDSLLTLFKTFLDIDPSYGVAHTAIKVMGSGIFYQGGLRGAANPGVGLEYEIIPITDIDRFIYDLAFCLSKRDAEYLDEQVKEGFAKIICNLFVLSKFVKEAKGKLLSNKLLKAWRKLMDLEQEIESKPVSPRKASKPQIKKEIAVIFNAHIQRPGTTKADRAAELLNVFGISATPEGMRDYFRNK
jgi:hypothetical protein